LSISVVFEGAGVRLRLTGVYTFDAAVEALLAATDARPLPERARLLVDGRGSDVAPPDAERIASLVAQDIPRLLERFDQIAVLATSFEHHEGARRIARASSKLSLGVLFVDPVAAERWLAGGVAA